MAEFHEKQVADKHVFSAAFADARPIEVPAPELGKGVVVRFRPYFTVDDLLAVASTEHWREPLVLVLLLARLALLDVDGETVVDPASDEWFQRGVDGVAVARLARRAGLVDRFVKAFRAAPDGEGEEDLTAEGVRRVIADVATALRLSPETVRAWPLRDLRDVLSAADASADAE